MPQSLRLIYSRATRAGRLGFVLLGLLSLSTLAGRAAAADRDKAASDCCGYSVAGTVYYDQNANGIREITEPPLAGWTVQVFDVSNVLVGTTVTDALGAYSFAVPVGCGQTFKIKQVVQSGWSQTFPALNGFHTGSGTGCSGEVFGPYNFGDVDTGCTGLTKVYTLNSDFALGTLSGAVATTDQLELTPTATTWPYAWVANAGEGTVSKIDIQTGNEVGRYYTGPPGPGGNPYGYLSPSRTVIDKDGNCWVANRTASADTPSVTQILLTGGDDRNANTIIDTATDANNNGIIGPAEILPWGQDERVKRHYQVGDFVSNPARGMVIDKMGYLWVGLSTTTQLVKVDPNLPIATYAPNQPPSQAPALVTLPVGDMPYGLALSPSGLIYMSTRGTWAFEIDPGLASGGTGAGPAKTDSIDHTPYFNYGIAVDKDCNVWLASCSHPQSIRWNPTLNTWAASATGASGIGRGITVDFNNNVWMSCNDPSHSVVRYNNLPTPTVSGVFPATGVIGPIGVGVASDGNLIVTGGTSVWRKLNTSTGAVMPLPGPELVGANPYTYSDFTGSLQSLTALQQGTWSVITDGGSPSIIWTLVSWTPSTPPGTSIQIEARVAQTLPALAVGAWTTLGTPGPLGTPIPGRYIETRARLQRTLAGCSPPFVTPILYDLTVQAICDTCNFVNCPPDTTIPCTSAQGAMFEYFPPLLEAECEVNYQITCSPPSGSVFPIGTTPVTCTAISGSDTAICTFNVTVLPGCNPTPMGACCLQNNCQLLTEHDCEIAGGVYFGDGSNCTVGCNYSCIPPPHHMIGWWKLDGATGTKTPNLANPALAGTLVGGPTPLPGENVNGAYSFNGSDQSMEVPNSPALAIGTSDLSMDAWVKTNVISGVRPIVDKRGGVATQGFGFFLSNGYPALTLAVNGAAANYALTAQNGGAAAFVGDNQWHLVAVTVDRDNRDGVQFYVDGQPVGSTFDPTPQSGSLDSPAPLWIARSHPLPTSRFFQGALDEIEIIHDHVAATKIAGIYLGGAAGKCPELCYATQSVPCCEGFSGTSSVTICNYDVVSHVYSYGLSPINGGPGCGPVGASSFTPNTGTVTVGPGSCVAVPIAVGCPTSIPVGQIACYQVSIFNHDTGRLFACKGSVRKTSKWCVKWDVGPATPVGIVTVAEAQSVPFQVEVRNMRNVSATLDYTIRPLAGGCCDGDQESTALRLNGLPPGTPVFGSMNLNPRGTSGTSVDVEYPIAWLIGYERLAMYGDDDGDGLVEKLGEIALRSIPTSLVDVPGEPPATDGGPASSRMFVTVPNPFGALGQIRFRLSGSAPAEVKLRLYDLNGRIVKVFFMEQLFQPGEHSVPWNARNDREERLGTGMYFLKLEVGDRVESVKVVVRR